MNKYLKYVRQHKIIFGFVAVVIVAIGGYWIHAKLTATTTQTKYVLTTVEKGTLVSSVSGSGQVSASSQVDIKPKVSGDVTAVGVVAGQTVKAGTAIAWLDATNAWQSVRDAQASLENAQLALQKLEAPASTLSVLQSQHSLAQAQESKSNATSDLAKTYDDGFTAVSNAFIDLPDVISGLHDVLYGTDAQRGQSNMDYYADRAAIYDARARQYRIDAETAYQTARTKYDLNFADYKAASRYSDTATIEALVTESYETTKSVAEAIKSAQNLIQFYEDKLTEHNLTPVATADTNLSSLSSSTGKTNAHLSNLLSITSSIQSDKETLVNADRTIAERTQSLADLQAPPDELDVKSAELTIEQRRNALTSAQENLADYTVRAPFDGTIASFDIKKGDSVSSGTKIATIITQDRIATISLNEVDAAKVAVEQKVTLTFDAIQDLTIAGTVAEVDTIGTVSQGVVSYGVQINFNEQDERVKPGMSLAAAIITAAKTDALMVPTSAVKLASDGSHYVEILDNVSVSDLTAGQNTVTSAIAPRRQTVEIGLSNDTSIEITSGLTEGQVIVASTVKSATASSSSSKSSGSLFSLPGMGGGARSTTKSSGGSSAARPD